MVQLIDLVMEGRTLLHCVFEVLVVFKVLLTICIPQNWFLLDSGKEVYTQHFLQDSCPLCIRRGVLIKLGPLGNVLQPEATSPFSVVDRILKVFLVVARCGGFFFLFFFAKGGHKLNCLILQLIHGLGRPSTWAILK